MFKTVIKFNTESKDNESVDILSNNIVKMFKNTNLNLIHNTGELVVTDTGSKNDFADFWSVFFKLKKAGVIDKSLFKEFSWINDTTSENLLTDFFKV